MKYWTFEPWSVWSLARFFCIRAWFVRLIQHHILLVLQSFNFSHVQYQVKDSTAVAAPSSSSVVTDNEDVPPDDDDDDDDELDIDELNELEASLSKTSIQIREPGIEAS